MPGSENNSFWIRLPWIIPGGVLFLGLLITLAEARSTWNDALIADTRRFDAQCESLWERLETKLEAYQHALERFQDVAQYQWPMDPMKWDTFIDRLNPVVNYDALADLRFTLMTRERWWKLAELTGSRHIRVGVRNPQEPTTLVPSGSGASLLWENNTWMTRSRCPTGLPDREVELAMSRALVNGLTRVSHPRVIGMDAKGRTTLGFTFAIPCYSTGNTSISPAEMAIFSNEPLKRRFKLALGVLTGSVSLDRLMESIFGRGPQEVCVELMELEGKIDPEALNTLFRRPMNQFPPEWAAQWGTSVDGLPWKPRFEKQSIHPFYTRQLGVHFYSTPLFEEHSTAGRAQTVLGLGTGLSLAVSVGLWTQIRGRRRAMELAYSLEESRQLLTRSSELQARISRDLHDGTVQSLFAIELGLGRAARRLKGTREEQLISNAIDEMDAMIRDLRGFLVELDPEISPSQRASSAMSVLADRLRKASGRDVQFSCDSGADVDLKQGDVVHLLQAAREGASNAIRHGRATEIRIRLSRDRNLTRLTVSDNGTGFKLSETTFHAGGGLTNMRLRAEKMKGTVKVESEPGGPTHMFFEFKNYE